MKSTERRVRLLQAGSLAALMLLGACDREMDVAPVAKESPAMPAAIIAPSEASDLPSQPSYEVGIASAAADHNRALEKCAEETERLRALCEAEADVAFAQTEEDLADLRGNQP